MTDLAQLGGDELKEILDEKRRSRWLYQPLRAADPGASQAVRQEEVRRDKFFRLGDCDMKKMWAGRTSGKTLTRSRTTSTHPSVLTKECIQKT
ncbi:hypothetical protein BTI71_05945 [Lactobacillus delbrueckii subsp. bulgaricus]|nr:hypothetical protein [Lactobacillus delbrueckii subsp. bulgaricus]MBT8929282.1 hypothetical protein [Lactobacillus delbrueckii subsp. bulgaricus]